MALISHSLHFHSEVLYLLRTELVVSRSVLIKLAKSTYHHLVCKLYNNGKKASYQSLVMSWTVCSKPHCQAGGHVLSAAPLFALKGAGDIHGGRCCTRNFSDQAVFSMTHIYDRIIALAEATLVSEKPTVIKCTCAKLFVSSPTPRAASALWVLLWGR